MKFKLSILILVIALIGSSCNREDLTPSYVIITKEDLQNSIDMSRFNDVQATSFSQDDLEAIANQDFTHIGLLVDGKNLGIYALPCKIPILASDSTQLRILPCFKMNGMSTTIRSYSVMVAPFVTTIYLTKDQNYTFANNPIKFEYYRGVHFPILEPFNNSTSFAPSDTSGVGLVVQNVDGQNIGVISIDHARGNFEIVSPELNLPAVGKNLFLELNYKCDQEMYVAVLTKAHNFNSWTQHSLIGIRSSDEWKKMYVNLTDIISNYSEGYSTVTSQLLFSGNSLEAPSAKFYFDNIKIIYIE